RPSTCCERRCERWTRPTMPDLATRIDAWLRGEAPGRLTRRERRALAHALEVLRLGVLREPRDGGRALDDETRAERICAEGARDAWAEACAAGREGQRPRPVRARLALLIRARLRADRGDCGRTRHEATGKRCQRVDHAWDERARCRYACGCWRTSRRITPLWQRAGEARR